ncbi:MAG: hypothetical protein ACO3A2_11075 [Bdellovibrionia bacterium]
MWAEPKAVSRQIGQSLKQRDPKISIESQLWFTKSSPEFFQGSLIRDFQLEKKTWSWLVASPSFQRLPERLRLLGVEPSELSWPTHVPVRLSQENTCLGNRENVFLPFPLSLNWSSSHPSDHFSLELIEVSQWIYEQAIAPCVTQVFEDAPALQAMFHQPDLRAQLIYVYSFFHELAHRIGPLRVSPEKDRRLNLSDFHFNTLGEIHADLIVFYLLSELPQVTVLIFLFKIFWYLRRDQKCCDSDGVLGVYFWRESILSGALRFQSSGQLSLDVPWLQKTMHQALNEVHRWVHQFIEEPLDQNSIVSLWFNKKAGVQTGTYQLPQELCLLFQKCRLIPTRVEPQ